MIKWHFYALLTGFFLDLVFGDPQWFPHPVRFIGSLITKTESRLRTGKQTEKQQLTAGIFLVLIVTVVSSVVPFLLLFAAYHIHLIAGFVLESFLCYTIFAAKALKDESMKVYKALAEDDVEQARYFVSRIVGRDTKSLTAEGITKAAVETVAENTSDGEIAPLIYTAIGGPVLGYFYKAVNTMDSMVGYKNEKYLYFGRFAAKTDDVLNYLPARVSALLMVLASFLCGLDGKRAFRVWRRDGRNHASPNSAQTESVCAGALGVRLAGDAWYFGTLYKKPTIGDDVRPPEAKDIKLANRLLYVTSFLTIAAAAAVYILAGL